MSFIQAECSIKSTAFDVTIATIDLFKYYAFKLRQQISYPLIRDLEMKPSKYLRKWVQPRIINDRYTFFEYQEGQILADVKFTKNEQITNLFYQLLCALYTIHSSQSLGRCFNVNNILMTPNDGIVLMEFGFYPIMKIIAPEQLQCMNNYNLKLDVYLIGRVLYHVMVREDVPEINGQFSTQAQYLHIHDSIAKTPFSQNLKNLVVSLLHYDTDRRPNFVRILQMIQEHQAQFEMKQYYLVCSKQLNDSISLAAVHREQQMNTLIQTQNLQELVDLSLKLEQTEESMDELQMLEIPIEEQSPGLMYQHSCISSNRSTSRTSSTNIKTDYGPPSLENTGNLLATQATQVISTDIIDNDECHRRLTILRYRHTYISDTIKMIVKLDDCEESLISICEFSLRKMLVILMKDFMNQIKSKQNIIGVQDYKWNKFLSTPENIGRHTQGMEFMLKTLTIALQTYHTGLLKKLQNIKNVNLRQYGTFISSVVTENVFEDAKLPYRLALTKLIEVNRNELTQHQTKSTNILFQTQLQLRLFTCLAINRLFDVQQIEKSGVLSPMLQCLNIPQLQGPDDFVNYYQIADVENMEKQNKLIQQIIFNC